MYNDNNGSSNYVVEIPVLPVPGFREFLDSNDEDISSIDSGEDDEYDSNNEVFTSTNSEDEIEVEENEHDKNENDFLRNLQEYDCVLSDLSMKNEINESTYIHLSNISRNIYNIHLNSKNILMDHIFYLQKLNDNFRKNNMNISKRIDELKMEINELKK